MRFPLQTVGVQLYFDSEDESACGDCRWLFESEKSIPGQFFCTLFQQRNKPTVIQKTDDGKKLRSEACKQSERQYQKNAEGHSLWQSIKFHMEKMERTEPCPPGELDGDEALCERIEARLTGAIDWESTDINLILSALSDITENEDVIMLKARLVAAKRRLEGR